MKFKSKIGFLLYSLALLASLTGALVLLTGFLLAADWNVGVRPAMATYLFFSCLGTIGLLFAIVTFWSKQLLYTKVALVSNVGMLVFAATLAIAYSLDSSRDYSPMIVGISHSKSFYISSVAWFTIPVVTSLLGTCASLLRIKNNKTENSEVTLCPH